MTVLKYITSVDNGCCTVAELLGLGRVDKAAVDKLKEYAREEMKNKGIEITES